MKNIIETLIQKRENIWLHPKLTVVTLQIF